MVCNICFFQTFKVSPNKAETKKDPEDTVGSLKYVYIWVCVWNWLWVSVLFFEFHASVASKRTKTGPQDKKSRWGENVVLKLNKDGD